LNRADALIAAGMGPWEANRKTQLFSNCEAHLRGVQRPSWYVPGRIEILGKHTDYAGGRSLLCAAEQGMCFVASRRADARVNITDCITGQSIHLSLSPDLAIPDRGWTVYPSTVARRLACNFPGTFRGADVAFASDVPRASGMSSSSVLVTGVFTILSAFNNLNSHPEYMANIRGVEDLAGYLGCIENGQTFKGLAGDRGVGTFGGSEDHTAILCGRAGELVQYSFCPVQFERSARIPPDCIFVIATSGVSAPKIGSARESYNKVSRTASAILSTWNHCAGRSFSSLAAAVSSTSGAAEEIRTAIRRDHHPEFSAEILLHRFEQFLLESQSLVPQALDSLAREDLMTFGKIVDQSQAAAEQGLANQVPETIALARSARTLGAHAASAFGAGFGGSVWALVTRNDAEAFRAAWRDCYLSEFPIHTDRCRFFLTSAGPPLLPLE